MVSHTSKPGSDAAGHQDVLKDIPPHNLHLSTRLDGEVCGVCIAAVLMSQNLAYREKCDAIEVVINQGFGRKVTNCAKYMNKDLPSFTTCVRSGGQVPVYWQF
jgi:hypothetical protein